MCNDVNKWTSYIGKKVKSDDGKFLEIPTHKLHVYPFFSKVKKEKYEKHYLYYTYHVQDHLRNISFLYIFFC